MSQETQYIQVPSELTIQLIQGLARIEATLQSHIVAQESRMAELGTDHVDHETRIRRLERTIWIASGAALASGGLGGAIVSQFLGG